MYACIEETSVCILKTGPSTRNNKCIPGWSEQIEQLRGESLQWHHHWRACWQPHTGHFVEIHTISSVRYHSAIRGVLKDYDKIKMERMADAITNIRIRVLWKETQKWKGHNTVKTGQVHGHVYKESISQ